MYLSCLIHKIAYSLASWSVLRKCIYGMYLDHGQVNAFLILHFNSVFRSDNKSWRQVDVLSSAAKYTAANKYCLKR